MERIERDVTADRDGVIHVPVGRPGQRVHVVVETAAGSDSTDERRAWLDRCRTLRARYPASTVPAGELLRQMRDEGL